MEVREAYKISRNALLDAGIAESEAKTKVIVSHVLCVGYSEVFSDINVSEDSFNNIKNMTERCASGEPVEYVTGKAYFRYLTLDVTPDVLIPRKETELVAEKAIELIRKKNYHSVLDMCTGSGCIAISVATETKAAVSASDISDKALDIAEKNSKTNKASGMIRLILSDMFDNIRDAYDLIVSNPPYVSAEEYSLLDNSVRLYEPEKALLAGDGLEFYRIIAAEGLKFLNPGGALVLEIGAGQRESVTALLKSGGFTGIDCLKDYEGRDRIICAFKE